LKPPSPQSAITWSFARQHLLKRDTGGDLASIASPSVTGKFIGREIQ
jgi:hypothetical protein